MKQFSNIGSLTLIFQIIVDHTNQVAEKMVDSELGEIPKGWKVGNLGEMVNNFDSKRIPLSKKQREDKKGQYPYFGATSIMDYIDDYIFEGVHVLDS